MKVYENFTFQDLLDDFWGDERLTLERIKLAGKEKEFVQLIDKNYPDGIEKRKLIDLLRPRCKWVYAQLDMLKYYDDEDEYYEEDDEEDE